MNFSPEAWAMTDRQGGLFGLCFELEPALPRVATTNRGTAHHDEDCHLISVRHGSHSRPRCQPLQRLDSRRSQES